MVRSNLRNKFFKEKTVFRKNKETIVKIKLNAQAVKEITGSKKFWKIIVLNLSCKKPMEIYHYRKRY